MNLDEKIIKRFDELISLGEQVLNTKKSPGPNVIGDYRVDSQLAHQWATNVQNLLVRILGKDSEHYKNFAKQVEEHSYLTFSPVTRAQGVLKAAKDDFLQGQLYGIRTLIEAEVFDDFLEQAEYLFNTGYYQAGAVIAGSVLEDGLRKLCQKHSIVLSSKPKLDTMNSELAKAGAYTQLVQKRITALADLRNKAAHGEWNQFTKADVSEMVIAVRRFMEEYFS